MASEFSSTYRCPPMIAWRSQACGPMAHIWRGVVFPSRRLVDIRAGLRYSRDEGAEFRLVVRRCSMAEPRDGISGK
jgi:hypothetical protein